jgi:hypothetical protein
MFAIPSANDLLVGTSLLWRLPAYLKNPVNPDEARLELPARFPQRGAGFLTIARDLIYGCAWSPYRRLLASAGCEYGDLERLVNREGLDAALLMLFRQGVYLTVDEYKGRRPVVRGSTVLDVTPDQLRSPRSSVHMQSHTSGSRGTKTVVGMDLSSLRDGNVNLGLCLDARRAGNWVFAQWAVPGGSAMRSMLRASGYGARPVRWFSQLDPNSPDLHSRYRYGAELLFWGGRLAGTPLPRPEYVPLDDPRPIVRWMTEVLGTDRVPHINTFPSSAVRLCQAAIETGAHIAGAQFATGGEPTTAARLASIGRAGAVAVPRYSAMESGPIAYGCLTPEAPDDQHLFHDLNALVQPGPNGEAAGLPADALLVTSLRPGVSIVLLNVSLGDQATIVRRDCGCPLSRLGWDTLLRNIRSHEKLTAGGMTFLDIDIVRVLEQVLPDRFGGAPIDYQLVEDEDEDGRPRLRLLIHPSVGPLDSAAAAETFLTAIARGSGTEHVMGKFWHDAGFLRVERAAPQVMASGKILHLSVHGALRSAAGRPG